MSRKSLYLAVVFFISVKLFAQNGDINLAIKQEASLKVASFLNLIPEGQERNYGFDSRADFSKIKIEEPYLTYYISYTNAKLTFVSGNEWRVPVSVDGRYLTLLTAQINNGTVEVVDIGAHVLAQKIQEFEKIHPNNGAQRVIIRNTFLKQDFIPSDFTSLYNKNGDVLEINASSTLLIYQINEREPIATNMAFFCEQTLNLINNTEGNK